MPNQRRQVRAKLVYRFAEHGKPIAERVVMNLGPLGATQSWQPG